ncbi:unnamed protein product [Mytilus coruscus]|uniref:Mab-21-like HhH/H2TH-like domain-containing protein n=1 Tax=Mytilus coruscus TaxID=42192 RepID=A0A6J8B1F8_MYTCO|nr:unnamed protein product [Mytilus coruscus]
MTDISRQIYQYMCDEIVGSEKVVKYRRLFFKIYEYVQNNFLLTSKYLISGGSKAEGLDLPGSDLDIMLISKKYIVYRSKTKTVNRRHAINKHILIIDTENAQPGFALLFVQNEPICDQNCVERKEDGTYLSSKLYILSFATKYTYHIINGPCLSNIDGRLDVAHSLLCPKWPSVAKDWATRKRSSGWPSIFLVSDIVKHGVLLVPIGSKSCSKEVHPLEWRISFSIPEKILIHTWSHTQILCYSILKILLKEVVKTTNGLESLLCSYFLKTTLFWLSEEIDTKNWIPEKLLVCFEMCLGRLVYWITHKYIPNYFIPEHNMIDRLYGQQSWDELLALMSFLHEIGWQSICLCDSFPPCAIFTYRENYIPPLYGFFDFEKAIIPLMNILSKNYHFLDVTYGSRHEAFTRCISFIIKATLPKKYKIVFLIMLSSISFNMTESLLCRQKSNKRSYIDHKSVQSCYLICAKTSVVTGWTLQALNLYLCGQYHSALTILEFAMSICSWEQFSISSSNDIHIRDFKERCFITYNCFSSLRQLKYYTRWFLFINNVQTFDYLLQLYPQQKCLLFATPFLLCYLRFTCYYRLQNIEGIIQSIQDLRMLCSDRLDDCYLRFVYQIMSDEYFDRYLNWIYTAEKSSYQY